MNSLEFPLGIIKETIHEFTNEFIAGFSLNSFMNSNRNSLEKPQEFLVNILIEFFLDIHYGFCRIHT